MVNVPIRAGYSSLKRVTRTLYRARFSALPKPGNSLDLEGAVRTAIGWMGHRYKKELGVPLPAYCFEKKEFELDQHGQSFSAVFDRKAGAWAGKVEHTQSEVGGRVWISEIGFEKQADGVACFARTLCSQPTSEIQRPTFSRPGIIPALLEISSLRDDVLPVSGRSFIARDNETLNNLVSLLENPRRQLPVVLLTEIYRPGIPRFLVEDGKLARDLAGVATVVKLDGQMSIPWANKVGREWSAWDGAIRIFRPGLEMEADDPRRHPWLLPREFTSSSIGSLTDVVIKTSFESLVMAPFDDRRVKTFNYLRATKSDRLRLSSTIPSEQLHNAVQEIAALREELNRTKETAEQLQSDSIEYLDESERTQRKNFYLTQRIEQLEELQIRFKAEEQARIEIPKSLSELSEWADKYFPGSLYIHSRALRDAKNCPLDPHFVYQGLMLLGQEYQRMKRPARPEGAERDFEKKLKSLNLDNRGSITASKAGAEGDEYFVEYPVGAGKREFLNMHLKTNSNTRQPERALRIYYFWSEADSLVVVG